MSKFTNGVWHGAKTMLIVCLIFGNFWSFKTGWDSRSAAESNPVSKFMLTGKF